MLRNTLPEVPTAATIVDAVNQFAAHRDAMLGRPACDPNSDMLFRSFDLGFVLPFAGLA
jgi:hypothetical protein